MALQGLYTKKQGDCRLRLGASDRVHANKCAAMRVRLPFPFTGLVSRGTRNYGVKQVQDRMTKIYAGDPVLSIDRRAPPEMFLLKTGA
jgi:hypothetical protein